jgi:hypothetical protein
MLHQLRSANPTLTPEQFDDFATAAMLSTEDQHEIDFLNQARLLNATANGDRPLLGRPIPNAADEVAATATAAREMLAELKAGWLWQILTIKTTKPS